MGYAEIFLVGGTVGTWALVGVTRWLAKGQLSVLKGQLSIAQEQRKIQLYLELRKDFDGHLIEHRKILARQFLENAHADEINEPVVNFFEDMGMLLRRDLLDHDMIWDTFSYYARMWRSACRDYIAKVRVDLGGDETLFTDFDYLSERMCEAEARKRGKTRGELEPSPSQLKTFLEAEAAL